MIVKVGDIVKVSKTLTRDFNMPIGPFTLLSYKIEGYFVALDPEGHTCIIRDSWVTEVERESQP